MDSEMHIKRMSDTEAMKYLMKTWLMGNGTVKRFGKNMFALIPLSDPEDWKKLSFSDLNRVDLDVFLLEKWESYIVFHAGDNGFAVPIGSNFVFLEAVYAFGSVFIARNMAEVNTKSKRQKNCIKIKLSSRHKKELYTGLLLYRDMVRKANKEAEVHGRNDTR